MSQPLTPQQHRVLLLLADGLLSKQIAYELGISDATAKAHVSAILKKLNASGRVQAVQLAAQSGILTRSMHVGPHQIMAAEVQIDQRA